MKTVLILIFIVLIIAFLYLSGTSDTLIARALYFLLAVFGLICALFVHFDKMASR